MEIPPDYTAQMRLAFDQFHEEVGKVIGSYGGLAVKGSQLATEMSSFSRPELVDCARAIGSERIEFGADHMSALKKLLDEPIEMIAAFTCVRSMLESCSLASWVLDPNVDVVARVGRVYSYRCEGMLQQLKAMRVINNTTEAAAVQDHLSKLVREAAALGYREVKDNRGRLIGIFQKMPSATEIISQCLGEGYSYRLLSAVAHGHFWAVSEVHLRTPVGTVESHGVKMQQMTREVRPFNLAFLGFNCMRALSRPVWWQAHLCGWDTLLVERIFEDVADRLQMTDRSRFWRSR